MSSTQYGYITPTRSAREEWAFISIRSAPILSFQRFQGFLLGLLGLLECLLAGGPWFALGGWRLCSRLWLADMARFHLNFLETGSGSRASGLVYGGPNISTLKRPRARSPTETEGRQADSSGDRSTHSLLCKWNKPQVTACWPRVWASKLGST